MQEQFITAAEAAKKISKSIGREVTEKEFNEVAKSLNLTGLHVQTLNVILENLDLANQLVSNPEKVNYVSIGNNEITDATHITFKELLGKVCIIVTHDDTKDTFWFDPEKQNCMIIKTASYRDYVQSFRINIEDKEFLNASYFPERQELPNSLIQEKLLKAKESAEKLSKILGKPIEVMEIKSEEDFQKLGFTSIEVRLDNLDHVNEFVSKLNEHNIVSFGDLEWIENATKITFEEALGLIIVKVYHNGVISKRIHNPRYGMGVINKIKGNEQYTQSFTIKLKG